MALSRHNLRTLEDCKQDYSLLIEVKQYLADFYIYQKLHTIVRDVFNALETKDSSPRFRKPLKLALWEIVDAVWEEQNEATKGSDYLQDAVNRGNAWIDRVEKQWETQLLERVPRMGNSSANSKSHTDLMMKLKTDSLVDSCFSSIKGAVTFPREPRKLSPHDPTPGPGTYDPDVSYIRLTPPRAWIPASGSRMVFSEQKSPGPAYYSPQRGFLSK